MLASVHSASVIGVDAHPVVVEVDVARDLPSWSIVGLASGAVKEAKERVCLALANSAAGLRRSQRRRRSTLPFGTRECQRDVTLA